MFRIATCPSLLFSWKWFGISVCLQINIFVINSSLPSRAAEEDNYGALTTQAETPLPTPYGSFQIMAYADEENNPMPYIAMVNEKINV